MAKNIFRIPIVIYGNTPEELSTNMLKNNKQHDKEYQYFDIQKEGTRWLAWFYETVIPKDMTEKLNARARKTSRNKK